MPSLTEKCVHFLSENLNTENVLDVLEQATRFDEKELEKQCWKVIKSKTDEVVRSDSFINNSHATLTELLKQDILKIQEVELFQAVLKWIDFQCSSKDIEPTGKNRRSVIGDAIYNFRFFAMSHEQFVQNVSKSGLLTAEEMIPIYERFLGFDSPALTWNRAKRNPKSIVRFSRFSRDQTPGNTSMYGFVGVGKYSLCVSVDEDVSLLGVRLFGDDNGSECRVTFKVKESKVHVKGTYVSEFNQDGVPGFDVMLEKPVRVRKDEVVTLSVTISGSFLVYEKDGLPAIVTLEGVSVTFSDAPSPNHVMTALNQPFHEIILAV